MAQLLVRALFAPAPLADGVRTARQRCPCAHSHSIGVRLRDAVGKEQEARCGGDDREEEEPKGEHGFSPASLKRSPTPAKCMPPCSNDRRALPAPSWCSSTPR